MGAFRNDSEERKVYFLPVDSITELLLYDFTMVIGDTIQGYLPDPENWGSPNIAVISAIDSIELADGFRKRWHFESSGDYNFHSGSIIEGIGGEFGPLEALMAMFDDNGTLNCFTQNSEVIYTIGGGISCELATGLIEDRLSDILMYPNPATDQLTIKGASGTGSIEIHTIQGILIKRLNVRSISEPVLLAISDVPPGIYQIIVKCDRDLWQGRFVKAE